jgi:hypothetical protein
LGAKLNDEIFFQMNDTLDMKEPFPSSIGISENEPRNWLLFTIFSLLLLTSLIITITMIVIHKHSNNNDKNILILLWKLLAYSLPLADISSIVPVLMCLLAGKMSHIIAELFMLAIFVFFDLFIILLAASSIIKLLLVVNFSLIFLQEPVKLARVLGWTAVTLALLPNLVFTVWFLVSHENRCSTPVVAYFVGNKDCSIQMSFCIVYLWTWLFISLVLVVWVVAWIPAYLKRSHNSAAIREETYGLQL